MGRLIIIQNLLLLQFYRNIYILCLERGRLLLTLAGFGWANCTQAERRTQSEQSAPCRSRRNGSTQAERNRSIRQSRARTGGFLPAVQKTEQLVFWFGILQPYKPAQSGQKRRCDGAVSRTWERVGKSRNALIRALKRE